MRCGEEFRLCNVSLASENSKGYDFFSLNSVNTTENNGDRNSTSIAPSLNNENGKKNS